MSKPHDLHPAVYVPCSPSKEDCLMCKGEACNFCGSRCCDHDLLARHMAPYMSKGAADD